MANFLTILSGGLNLLIVALFLSVGNLTEHRLPPRWQQGLRGALFVLAGVGALMFPVYADGDALLDQRAAILATAAVFGGAAITMATGAAMLACRVFVGGSAMPAGLFVIIATVVSCVPLVSWWRRRYGAQQDLARLILLTGIAAGLCSVLALLLVPPAATGWKLFLQEGPGYFLVQLASACLLGFLLKMQAERQQSVQQIAQQNSALRATLEQAIGALSTAMAYRDPGEASHQSRIVGLVERIGVELGIDGERLEGLKLAAMVHDIGKVQVPAEILKRPRKLSDEEFALVRMHAEYGYQILKDVRFPWPLAEIVRQHHENYDGGGYPAGLAGEDILLEARILRVADSMETMLSHRPFRHACSLDFALASLESGKGACYDPQVVDACVRIFRENRFSFNPPCKAA